MYKTTRGLILREVRYKEADRILTVLTQDEGKITVRARGALRKGSRTGAATQLLTFSELTLFGNRGRWSLNEGSTIEEFKGLREDISALALASYFAECTEAMSDEDSPDPNLLQLILNCLFALSGDLCPQLRIKTAFELRLMCLSGYEPDLSACAVCGETEPQEPYFSAKNGLICCKKCRNASLGANIALTEGALSAMRYITHCEPRKLLSFMLPDADTEKAAFASENYLLTQTERSYASLDYYNKVK